MTDDLDLARTRMTENIQWWPLLDDVADSLLGVTGHGVDLAGIHTTSGTSATELAVIQLEEIQQISIDLTALAKKMGYRPGLDGTARHYVHANLAWARKNLAAAEVDPIITDLHKAIARLTGHAPRPTGRTCPACGTGQLRLLEDERLHCEECDIARHPDEIKALTTWRATNADVMVTRREAALILGEPENTIKQRIRRRQPDYELINGTRHCTISDLKQTPYPKGRADVSPQTETHSALLHAYNKTMRTKTITLAIAALLTLTACSDDEATGNEPTTTAVEPATTTTEPSAPETPTTPPATEEAAEETTRPQIDIPDYNPTVDNAKACDEFMFGTAGDPDQAIIGRVPKALTALNENQPGAQNDMLEMHTELRFLIDQTDGELHAALTDFATPFQEYNDAYYAGSTSIIIHPGDMMAKASAVMEACLNLE